MDDETELEIIVSEYYDVLAENEKRYSEQNLDDRLEIAADSSQENDEVKFVDHEKIAKARALKNLRNRRYQIFKNSRLGERKCQQNDSEISVQVQTSVVKVQKHSFR